MSGTTKYGQSTLYNNTGPNNTGFGEAAAFNNLDASCNTAIGANALYYNTTAPHNTAIGAGAMCNNTTGSLNTAVGSSALEGLTQRSVGDQNVAIGAQALYNNSDASCNTAIGTFSGYYNVSGNYNTFLGYITDVSNNGTNPTGIYNNSTALGYNAIIDASNQMVFGTSSERVKIPGSYVGIGGNFDPNNPYPDGGTYALDVSGNINAYYINLSSEDNYTNNPNGVVPKSYVDAISSGLNPLAQCQCATTALVDLTAAPPTTIDGYTLITGDRVLVNYQASTNPNSASVDNGIYVVNLTTSPYWARSTDMPDTNPPFSAVKTSTFIQNGTLNGGAQFIQIEDPADVGDNALLFQIFIRQVQAGRGLEKNGVYFDVDTSLNFVNYLDNDSTGPSNPNTLNLGTNTNNIYIGKPDAFSTNKISVTQNSVGINLNNPSSNYVLDVSGILHFQSNIGEKIILYGNPGYSYGLGVQSGLLEMYVRDNLSRLGFGYLNSGNFVETLTVKVDKVGINDTTPGYNLDVSGVLHINTNSDVTSTTNGLLIGGGGLAPYDVVDIHPTNVSGYWYFNKVGNFGFYNSGSKYELSTSGNASFTGTLGVGGTTTLSDTLTLNGSTGAKRQITASYLNLTDIGGGSGDIQIYQSGVNTLYDNNEDGGTHQFVVGNTTQYFPLLLNTSGAQISGNVGIGTTPTYQGISFLQNGSGITWGANYTRIYDDGNLNINTDDRLYINAPTSLSITSPDTTVSGNLQVSNEILLLTTNSLIRMCGDTTNNYIQSAASVSTAYKPLIFSQYGSASPTLYLDIQNYRVGIATNSPNYALDVNGNINFTGTLTQNGSPITGLTQWSTSGSNIYYNTGNVGIGTSTPTYTLHVVGSVNGTSYNSTSDYRIKENVTQLDNKFVVDKLNPVTYLNKKSNKQDIGLIAHELQEIYPELVNGEKDGEEFQSVNYIGLIPILIKEIQVLKERVKILEERNNN